MPEQPVSPQPGETDVRERLLEQLELFSAQVHSQGRQTQRQHSSVSYEAPLPFEAMKLPGKVSTVRG